jgi:glucan endo-1,3-alpha-glucosidase
MVRRFAGNPRYAPVYFKYRGAYVLSTFAGDKLGVAAWHQIRTDLATGRNPSNQAEPTTLSAVAGPPSNASIRIFLVPAFFWGGELPSRSSIQQSFDEWRTTLDGFFYWGIAGIPGSGGALDQLPSSHSYGTVLHEAGKLYMAPICFQFWGANANRYYEYSGAAEMRALWMDAINVTHPDWVEIISWNDFIEGTYVSPIDDPNKYPGANFLDSTGVPIGTLDYFHSHSAATALLSFFIQWYKTGVEPTVTHDTVYYFYRTQLSEADAGSPPVAHKFGPVGDLLYITANLAAPAELHVTTGGETKILPLQAGSTDLQTPVLAGRPPILELIRNGQTIGSSTANDPIHAVVNYNDYYYSTGTVSEP